MQLFNALDKVMQPSPSLTSGYLDDIALVMINVSAQLPVVLRLYDWFESFSGRCLNLKKTVLVPSWPILIEDFEISMMQLSVKCHSYRFQTAAKHIGVFVGQNACERGGFRAFTGPTLKNVATVTCT